MASSRSGLADGLLTDLVLAQARTQGSYRGSASSHQCGPLRAGGRAGSLAGGPAVSADQSVRSTSRIRQARISGTIRSYSSDGLSRQRPGRRSRTRRGRWWSRSPSAQNGHRQLPDHNTCQSRASALAADIGRQARWCSYFRLLGHPVATDNPDHKRAGYTRFKRSFGGQVKEYAGRRTSPSMP